MMGNQIDEWWESHKTGDERVDKVFGKFLGVDGIHLPEQPYDGHTDSMKLTPDEIEEAIESYGQDSRDKLEAEVRSHYAYTVSTLMYPDSLNKKTDMLGHLPVDTVIGWLDRQAAITRRERMCPGYEAYSHRCRYHDQDFELNDATVSRLKRENANLRRKVAELEDEGLYAGGSAEDWYHIARDLMETRDEIARTLDRIAGLMGANDG